MKAAWPKARNLFFIGLFAVIACGGLFSHYAPRSPLLAWWILVAMALGTWVSFSPGLKGFSPRAELLVILYLFLLPAGLFTTQYAAARINSSTHLRYEGIAVENRDSISLGTQGTTADIVFPSGSSTSEGWVATLSHVNGRWVVTGAGMDELRLSGKFSASFPLRVLQFFRLGKISNYDVPNAAILTRVGDRAVVAGSTGTDTLTVTELSEYFSIKARSNSYTNRPVNGALKGRIAKQLRAGIPIGSLEGHRTHTDNFDRAVRIRSLRLLEFPNSSIRDISLGSLIQDWIHGHPRLMVTTVSNASITGEGSIHGTIAFQDSARIEIRRGNELWRFDAVETIRHDITHGLAIKFIRNPRPQDIPLPTGVSCTEGAACGVLSLRRLNPPIASIALGTAGFSTARYGLLAKLNALGNDIQVILPTQRILLKGGEDNPAYLPVSILPSASQSVTDRDKKQTQWVLARSTTVASSGLLKIIFAGVGLSLILHVIFRTIQATGVGSNEAALSGRALIHSRSFALGLNAVLGLLLTRLVIGARVSFFSPFEPRGLDTAVGLWISISVVIVSLLKWRIWIPTSLLAGRTLFRDDKWPVQFKQFLASRVRTQINRFRQGETATRLRTSLVLLELLIAFGLFMYAVPGAVKGGLAAAFCVLLVWTGFAWCIAFSTSQFHTFERGPLGIVEEVPRHKTEVLRDSDRSVGSTLLSYMEARALHWYVLPSVLAGFSLMLPPLTSLLVGIAVSVLSFHYAKAFSRKDPKATLARALAVLFGASTIATVFSLLRVNSDNGAMALFAAIILVTLTSVRAGLIARHSRLPKTLRKQSATPRELAAGSNKQSWFDLTLLLGVFGPVLLLAPLTRIDMGLFLVAILPIGFASLLASGVSILRWPMRLVTIAGFGVLIFVLATKVLHPVWPSVNDLRLASTANQKAEYFNRMGTFLGVHVGGLERASARAVAAADQRTAEELLVVAAPGAARDLLIPSIEQAWGARAYSASGILGAGMGQAPVGEGGVAEAVSYAENSFAVYVLGEHGSLGGIMVLALYLSLALAILLYVTSMPSDTTDANRASRALFLVATLLATVPAAYVILSNLGAVPITGQNVPFLGLNSWSDVTLCCGLIAFFVTGAINEGKRALGYFE